MRPLAALLALALLPTYGAAQSFQATLSRDTVPMGEVFELLVRVPVPPGSVVYFPDTIASTDVLESHGDVRWAAEAAVNGGATLTLTYPLISWGAGVVPVPGFDVFVSPVDASPRDAPRLPGGSYTGRWSDAPNRGGDDGRPLRIPRRGVSVTPVFAEEQMQAGVEPMPTADVVGASWHWPSIALGLVFSGALAVLARREWRLAGAGARKRGGIPWTPAASRLDALGQLDGLLEEKLPAAGRTQELYTRSTAIVRRFIGRMDPALGADLTSSEVMGRLLARPDALANGRGTGLFREMNAAEVVKFGRSRPGERDAEAHIRSLRDWVEACGDSL